MKTTENNLDAGVLVMLSQVLLSSFHSLEIFSSITAGDALINEVIE
jgi:hypothetical protein